MLRGRGDSSSFDDAELEDAEEESSSDEEDEWEDESRAADRARRERALELGVAAAEQRQKERRRRGTNRFLPVQLQFLMSASNLQDSMLEANNQWLDERKDDKYVLPFCRRSLLFMRQFKYVHLHPKNPLVSCFRDANKLRQVLHQRREVHKLFDLIRCDFGHLGLSHDFSAKASSSPGTKLLRRNVNLLLRDTYLTFEQLLDLDACSQTLQQMKRTLTSHIMSECTICEYQGERCQFTGPTQSGCLFKDKRRDLRRIWRFDVQRAAQCRKCLKRGHRECFAGHQC